MRLSNLLERVNIRMKAASTRYIYCTNLQKTTLNKPLVKVNNLLQQNYVGPEIILCFCLYNRDYSINLLGAKGR